MGTSDPLHLSFIPSSMVLSRTRSMPSRISKSQQTTDRFSTDRVTPERFRVPSVRKPVLVAWQNTICHEPHASNHSRFRRTSPRQTRQFDWVMPVAAKPTSPRFVKPTSSQETASRSEKQSTRTSSSRPPSAPTTPRLVTLERTSSEETASRSGKQPTRTSSSRPPSASTLLRLVERTSSPEIASSSGKDLEEALPRSKSAPEGALQRLLSGSGGFARDVRCPQISATALALDASFCQPSAFN